MSMGVLYLWRTLLSFLLYFLFVGDGIDGCGERIIGFSIIAETNVIFECTGIGTTITTLLPFTFGLLYYMQSIKIYFL